MKPARTVVEKQEQAPAEIGQAIGDTSTVVGWISLTTNDYPPFTNF